MLFGSSFLKYQLILAFFSILKFMSISYTSRKDYSLIPRRSKVTHIHFLLFPLPIGVRSVPLLKLSDLFTISLMTNTVISYFTGLYLLGNVELFFHLWIFRTDKAFPQYISLQAWRQSIGPCVAVCGFKFHNYSPSKTFKTRLQ